MTPLQAARSLRELARVPSRVARTAAPKLRAELMRSFTRGEDPYGRAWAPLKPATLAKGRRPPPLTATGKGKRGITFRPTSGAGIAIDSAVRYMRYHMRATLHRAARKFLPENRLPKRWLAVIKRETIRESRKTLGDG